MAKSYRKNFKSKFDDEKDIHRRKSAGKKGHSTNKLDQDDFVSDYDDDDNINPKYSQLAKEWVFK